MGPEKESHPTMLDVAIHRTHPTDVPEATTVCRLDGELVSESAPVLRALRGRLANVRTLLVDLTGISRFDRPGLGALIGVLRQVHPNDGRVELLVTLPALTNVLRADGFDRFFPLVTDGSERSAR
jgi:anti-anti-sigma factor